MEQDEHAKHQRNLLFRSASQWAAQDISVYHSWCSFSIHGNLRAFRFVLLSFSRFLFPFCLISGFKFHTISYYFPKIPVFSLNVSVIHFHLRILIPIIRTAFHIFPIGLALKIFSKIIEKLLFLVEILLSYYQLSQKVLHWWGKIPFSSHLRMKVLSTCFRGFSGFLSLFDFKRVLVRHLIGLLCL